MAETELRYIQEYSNILQERIHGRGKKGATAVEKMIYNKDKLLFLIMKRRLITNEIQALKSEFYACAAARDQACVSKFEEQIQKLVDKKKGLFDISKLRRTVIHGIPCDFVKFDESCMDVTEHLLNNKNTPESEAPGASQGAASLKTTSTINTEEAVGASADDFKECINLRAEIWNIMCNIDGLKEDMLREYAEERQRREEARKTPGNDDHELSVIQGWCNQFVDDEDDKYNEGHGGLDVDGYVK